MHSAYWRFAGRRILGFVFVYAILVYVFSALMDTHLVTQVEQTLRWSVLQAAQGMLASGEVTPEDYAQALDEMYESARHGYGFDRPFLVRVHLRALRVLRFDFGLTNQGVGVLYRPGVSALSVIAEHAVPTLVLFTGAFLVQLALGALLGLRNATRVGSFLDRITVLLATSTMSIPAPVAAMLAILIFVYAIPLSPSTPWLFHLPASWSGIGPWAATFFSHLALPLATVVLLSVWSTAHTVRNVTLGVFQEDFISASRARGLPEYRVVLGHGLRTAAAPIATLATVGLFASLWGSFLVEPIFQLRGIGTLFLDAIRSNDVGLLFALLVMVTGATQLALMVLDLTYGRLDPRIRVGGRSSSA